MRISGTGNLLMDIHGTMPVKHREHPLLSGAPLRHVTDEEMTELLSLIVPRYVYPGGGTATTLSALAACGARATLAGTLGSDTFGDSYSRAVQVQGLRGMMSRTDRPTGICLTLHGMETKIVRTSLGAARELAIEHLPDELFVKNDFFYMEGFLLHNPELFDEIVKRARSHEQKVCLDGASVGLISRNKSLILRNLDAVSYLFLNRDEAVALSGHENPNQAGSSLAGPERTVIVKLDKEGCLIFKNNAICKVDTSPTQVVDDTGAGDTFAAGFLLGMNAGLSLEEAGILGTRFGTYVVSKIGGVLSSRECMTLVSGLVELPHYSKHRRY